MAMGLLEQLWKTRLRLQGWFAAVLSARESTGLAQSTVEYALVGALVVIAAAGALTLLGDQVTAVFTRITSALSGR
jgi:Flp pilus assembly pilin Flp